MENRRRVEEEYMKIRVHYHPDDGDKITSKKRKAPAAPAAPALGKKRKVDGAPTSKPFCNLHGHSHFVFVFEFALGYALFDARGMRHYPGSITTYKIAEEYLNTSPFTLRAFYPFSSPAHALLQMKSICNSTVTKELKSFILDNIQEHRSDYRIAVANHLLASRIFLATGISTIAGQIIDHVMRGLRVKIDQKFIIGLELGDLKMAQLNLGRSYRGQIPGKVLNDDKLISVQNEDDGTEVEYRVWNPHMSKLAAAVLGGLTNIWVKPGSHVLYLGDVCGLTVLQLSDLVGSDGLVYVIGLSDALANTVEVRSNVVTLPGNFCFSKDYNVVECRDHNMVLGFDYRMVIGMVDVILGDIVYPDHSWQLNYIARYALLHLKTGGHYLISTRAKHIKLTSQVKDPFADHDKLPLDMRIEFETNELVMLEPIGRGHAMAVGSYRMGK
ncbi:hypothetical protein POM88_013841 [Heracleum sosnowskyi]|uniref:Uncharacterized protein n=1 Tax=Heracleum sosnowskyi TaxID=360622 RepID=A0AAD8MYI1_9APIA|nr:hypothetical protein POM88_013841 [Heracleum sosnowskyi]